MLFPQIVTVAPFDFPLVAAVLVALQFQDLTRRFFYVTERPVRAFLSDFVAYGARLAIIAFLAWEGVLTIDRVWMVMVATGLAATLFLWPDIGLMNAPWAEIREVTRRHMRIAGWLVASAVTWWFSESGFILMVVGTVLGPIHLGAARAVQNLVSLANPLVLSLENFAPSAATKALIGGGPPAMLRYITRLSFVGAGGILLMTVLLTMFVEPILHFVYGRTFPDEVAITAILGTCLALAYVTSVIFAGLRALQRVRWTVFFQAVMGALCLVTAWPVAANWGVVGALGALLVARVVLTSLFALSLRAYASSDGARVVMHNKQVEREPADWSWNSVRHAMRGGKFMLLRGLAAVCEPMTRVGFVQSRKQVGILTFHRVVPEVPGAPRLTWNVPPDLFRRQLAGLLQLGFEPWSLQQLLRALAESRALPPRTFVVTFDDGYANFHDYAWPILRELKVPATVFLATHYLDQDTPFPFDDWSAKGAQGIPSDRWRPLSAAQIRAMMADPLIEFGSHSHMHTDCRDDPAIFSRDLAASVASLRTQFGIEAPTFAFPFGAHNDAMVAIVRASGARCALSGKRALIGVGADPYHLGRFNVDRFETSKTLSLKLDGWYEWLNLRPSSQTAHSTWE
jgi:peptidoglycan/xylan/chitin deacetylase (PgdA/CDA1 family)